MMQWRYPPPGRTGAEVAGLTAHGNDAPQAPHPERAIRKAQRTPAATSPGYRRRGSRRDRCTWTPLGTKWAHHEPWGQAERGSAAQPSSCVPRRRLWPSAGGREIKPDAAVPRHPRRGLQQVHVRRVNILCDRSTCPRPYAADPASGGRPRRGWRRPGRLGADFRGGGCGGAGLLLGAILHGRRRISMMMPT